MSNMITSLDLDIENKLKNTEYRLGFYSTFVLDEILMQLSSRRNELGLTQAELADKAGTKQSVISRLENLDHYPNIRTLFNIANALDCRLKIDLVPLEKKQ